MRSNWEATWWHLLAGIAGLLTLVTLPSVASARAYVFGRTDYAVGSRPQGLVSGDFNEDGKPDLAVLNNQDNTVSVLVGNSDGTFQTHVDYATGAAPFSIATGDLNGDGKLDLAVANFDGNSVSILISNGDGTFQKHVDYAISALVPVYPLSVVTGDFNVDGRLDIAVAGHYCCAPGGWVALMVGNGDGTFQSARFIESIEPGLTTGLSAMTTGDLNGDGKPDLAVAIEGALGGLWVFLNNGDGTFESTVAISGQVISVVPGDFNGDGKLDLGVSNFYSAFILLGNGDGTFQAPLSYNNVDGAESLSTGDFNGDGKLDLALVQFSPLPCDVGGACAGLVSILLGNGDGTLRSAVDYVTGSGPASVCAADFNGDGTLDLAVANSQSNTISVFLNLQNFPPSVAVVPPNVDFGSVAIGSTGAPQTITIANFSEQAFSIRKVLAVPPKRFTEFSSCSGLLSSGESCTINLVFMPSSKGSQSGFLFVFGKPRPRIIRLRGSSM